MESQINDQQLSILGIQEEDQQTESLGSAPKESYP